MKKIITTVLTILILLSSTTSMVLAEDNDIEEELILNAPLLTTTSTHTLTESAVNAILIALLGVGLKVSGTFDSIKNYFNGLLSDDEIDTINNKTDEISITDGVLSFPTALTIAIGTGIYSRLVNRQNIIPNATGSVIDDLVRLDEINSPNGTFYRSAWGGTYTFNNTGSRTRFLNSTYITSYYTIDITDDSYLNIKGIPYSNFSQPSYANMYTKGYKIYSFSTEESMFNFIETLDSIGNLSSSYESFNSSGISYPKTGSVINNNNYILIALVSNIFSNGYIDSGGTKTLKVVPYLASMVINTSLLANFDTTITDYMNWSTYNRIATSDNTKFNKDTESWTYYSSGATYTSGDTWSTYVDNNKANIYSGSYAIDNWKIYDNDTGDTIADSLDSVITYVNSISTAIGDTSATVVNIFNSISSFFSSFWTSLSSFFSFLTNTYTVDQLNASTIVTAINSLSIAIENVGTVAYNKFTTYISNFVNGWGVTGVHPLTSLLNTYLTTSKTYIVVYVIMCVSILGVIL